MQQPHLPVPAVSPSLADDSDGEEEILETWQTTKAGTFVVHGIREANESKTMTGMGSTSGITATIEGSAVPTTATPVVSAPSLTSLTNQSMPSPTPSMFVTLPDQQPSSVSPPLSSPVSSASSTVPASSATPMAPAQTAPAKPVLAAWFLGGNHSVKLLTSVDGDFDPQQLSSLATVPAVIGELALSVESLVSDDSTEGDFAQDILAKIAENTIAAKRASLAQAQQQQQQQQRPHAVPSEPNSGLILPARATVPPNQPLPSLQLQQQQQPPSVPNPLVAPYKPVPNPLARITPPTSPVTTASIGQTIATTTIAAPAPAVKRKASPVMDQQQPNKIPKCNNTSAMIAAR